METTETKWTKENLLKLLSSLKANIPKMKKRCGFRKELEAVDWGKVVVPPFSSQECQEKWTSVMKNIPKIRNLAELIGDAEDVISNPRHNAKWHPEIPKTPLSATAAFYQEKVTQIKQKHPKLPSSELVKKSFDLFSNLPPDEKSKREKKRKHEVKEYETELKKFCNKYGKARSRSSLRRWKKKMEASNVTNNEDEADLPCKPLQNAYMLFCKEQGKSPCDGRQGVKRMHRWSNGWRSLSETEKRKYYDKHKELQEEYYIKLNNYLKRFDEKEQKKILMENGLSISKLKLNLKIATKIPNEPEMPIRSVHTFFVKEKMKLLKHIPNSQERFAEANKMWKCVSLEERKAYEKKIKANLRKYTNDLLEWFQNLSPKNQKLYLKKNPSKGEILSLNMSGSDSEEERVPHLPSDSEDEELDFSSSGDEERNVLNLEEDDDEDDEEEGENMFEMYSTSMK